MPDLETACMFLRFRPAKSAFERVCSLGGKFCHVDLVVEHPTGTRVYAAYHGQSFASYPLPVWDLDDAWIPLQPDALQAASIVAFLLEQLGVPYNYGVYMACPLGLGVCKYPPRSWFCSEICLAIVKDFLLPAEVAAPLPSSHSVTPNALYALMRSLGYTELVAIPPRADVDATESTVVRGSASTGDDHSGAE
jgi:hypothetical protein